MVLILQGRGHTTAQQLAQQLEVSVRTIYRDAEALQEAGIPLLAAAGPAGGYRLPDSYRTRLAGLSESEAKGLFLTGLAGPAAELGLGAAVAAAELKLAAALPARLVDQAVAVQERVHLDATGWYARADPAPHLTEVADAVWAQRRIRITYNRWKAPDKVRRTLDPYGLVLKAGRWYLVACSNQQVRTYRVDQILKLSVLDQHFARPVKFDLPGYWTAYLAEFQAHLYPAQATIRLTAAGRKRIPLTMSDAIATAVEKTAIATDGGRIQAVVPIESIDHAESEFLRLGADIEIIDPPELRRRLTDAATRLHLLYSGLA
jgi:predicted DNA-binding transcriptional regulator YafY